MEFQTKNEYLIIEKGFLIKPYIEIVQKTKENN